MKAAISPATDPNFADSRLHGERAQLELLRQVVKLAKGRKIAVDVGAHIGLWARNLAPHFQAVFAFEPNAENAACFRKNVEGLANVFLAELALGDVALKATFKLPPLGNSGMWHVDKTELVDGAANMQCLDTANLNGLDLLKLDVEGYEGRVIIGAARTILEFKPVIVFEDNGLGQKYFGDQWVNPVPLLKKLGYKLRFTWRKDQVWVPA
jgi:FkbM family methyltransferase